MLKKQKINVEDAINALRKSLKSETLASDKEQDLNRLSIAAAFVNMISEKEKTIKPLSDAEKKVEKEFKSIETFLILIAVAILCNIAVMFFYFSLPLLSYLASLLPSLSFFSF